MGPVKIHDIMQQIRAARIVDSWTSAQLRFSSIQVRRSQSRRRPTIALWQGGQLGKWCQKSSSRWIGTERFVRCEWMQGWVSEHFMLGRRLVLGKVTLAARNISHNQLGCTICFAGVRLCHVCCSEGPVWISIPTYTGRLRCVSWDGKRQLRRKLSY